MKFSFLRYLKHVLTQPISVEFHREHTNAEVARTYATPECSVKMFISSTRIDNDNLNFQAPALADGEGENFLYQFRILSLIRPAGAATASAAAGSSAK